MGAVVFALLAAIAYGTGDFAAGFASRRLSAGPVTVFTQAVGLVGAGIAVVLVPGVGPSGPALWWGAASGVGAALGVLTLYRGLAVASMGVVAPVCAVLTAVLPVAAGLAGGEHLSVLAVAAIGVAIIAIALVSRGEAPPSNGPGASTGAPGSGLLWGSLAGVGFAVLFIALDRAGTSSGAWPLLPSGAVSLLLVLPFGWAGRPRHLGQIRSSAVPLLVAGIVGGAANLLFLTATGYGQLSLVAVITSLYPAVTTVLARTVLAERWTRLQTTGLIAAVLAIVATTLT